MSRKISNYENFAQLSADHNRRRYTVERTESSVSNVSSRIENGQFIDTFISVLKWLTAIFVFSVVMFCVVASKICLLVLGEQFKNFNQTKTSALKEDVETSKQASILMLVLVLMIPQVVSFVYATWTNLRRKSRPWPTKQGFILILIGGFLESLSLCYITIVGLTVLPVDPSAIVLLMCSLAVVPSIWQATKSRSRFNTMSGKLHVFKFGASAVIALLGIALLTWKTPDMSARIGIPIAFILLSIAWSPKLRKHQIRSKHQSAKEFRETTVRSSVSGVSGYMYNNDTEQGVTQGPPVKRRTACGKAAIVSSLWKLILTPFFALTFIKLYDIVELDNIFAGLRDINVSNSSFVYFMLHVFASFFGYHFGWLACSLCLQRVGYALPLTLATPIVILMIHVTGICETDALPLSCRSEEQVYILPAGTLLWVAQFVSTTYYVWKGEGMILAKAQDLFWIPDYNGICLEQYLLLNRRNEASDEEHVTQQNLSRDIRVFICTTMYHEEDYEMEQLLRSIHDVDMNSGRTGHQFESHVFFDGCVRVEVLNSYALKLASLVEKALKVRLTECSKMKTPYGMQLKWRLPGGMDFIIHLKDNAKVKNKKRWSQVMYMSYVLDYKQRLLGVNDEQSFILTTDADVKFTHESVEALIDQIIEDPRTGAVCARTHPLGNGPVVWYQIFDYAIGHWFQKVANHMLGSVLCSPGCFSLYRCQAVREVLPTYATNVDHAFEFLTKDMGEDRWMCTLMVQRGWRLTYCAAAEDSTYCPESFDELYKQRRRWTPSTLANLVLLVSEWKRILKNNEHISFLFILYQTFLVCATVIGPSTVILVIVSGMLFSGLAVNEITIVVLISLVVVVYTLICLFTSQNFQLRVSKLLTFVFAVIMCIVFIGVAVKISNEIKGRPDESTGMPTPGPNSMESATSQSLEQHLPAGVSTLYLAGLSGIFIAAALLHPNEFTCLFHGIWYLLCLPSGYLLLTIYSLCNLTDRSWGTREEKSASQEEDWYKPIANLLMKICKCCQSQQTREERHAASQAKRRSIVESRTSIKAELTSSSNKVTESSDENGNKEMTSFTAKGEVFIKTETTEDTQTSKNLEATRPEKKSTKNPVNNASSGAEQNTSVAANDDADQNCQFPTTVVYSAQEIPRKSLATSSSKKSKEAWKLSTGEINEENSLKGAFHKSSSGESIDPLPGSYAQGSVSPEKIKTGDGVKREEYSSARDHSANSLVHEGAKTETTEDTQTSKNLEATRPEKKSTKSPVNNASSGAEQNNSVAATDDADQNCQFPTTVVYSAQEIPRKSLATSSSKKSKEAWKLSTGEINEENSLKGAFHKSSSGESIDPLPGSYAQGSVSPEKIKTGDGVKREEYSSARDHSANSLVHEGAKTETTEDAQTSKSLEATRPEKKSTKSPVNNASSGAEQNTSVAANDDADQNCQSPTIVVYSAQEIPRKSLATSSSKKSKEAWKLSTGEINEENSLKSAFHKSSSGESIDPLPGSYAQGSVSPEKIKTGDGVKREEYSSAKDHSANSLVHEGAMPQKSDVGQVISDGEMQKQTGKRKRSVPLRVSTLITSSASMFQESTDQPEKGDEHLTKNPELSVKFRSNLSLRTLHENDRPMTALKNDVSFSDLNLPVEEWLPRDFKRYASNFREHGYDTAGYLPGMTDKDLQLIGIHTRGHRQRLIRDIRKIPRVDIEEDIPQNVQEWLEEHGLGEYWPMFESSGYTEPSDLEDLKNINKDNLKETFNIQKPGHFNRLLSAIRKLQYPNQGQIKLRHTRRELDRLPLLYLDVDNQDDGIEYEFWEGLRQTCLVPESSAFDQTSKLKEKLVELRNTTLLVFGVSNALWMIIILTLVRQKELNVFGVDVIGLAFLLIYGFLIILQFLALLGHRFKTIVHILARTPWTLSKKVGNNRVSSFESESSHPTR